MLSVVAETFGNPVCRIDWGVQGAARRPRAKKKKKPLSRRARSDDCNDTKRVVAVAPGEKHKQTRPKSWVASVAC
jgi:hypothetical protein